MIVARVEPEISVVVPAHNEADNLPTLIEEIKSALQPTGRSYEIVVVDDASSDSTRTLLNELTSQYPSLEVFRMAKQSGQSAALSAGFDVARGDIIVTIDADLQNDPADIPKLVEMLDRYDAAAGWRHTRKDTMSKRLISKVANSVRRWATGDFIKDTGCGLKAIRRTSIDKIHRFAGMHRFFTTLVKMHGGTVVEVPVNHRPRVHGRTHYNIFNRSIRPLMDLFGVCWLKRRTLVYEVNRANAGVPVRS